MTPQSRTLVGLMVEVRFEFAEPRFRWAELTFGCAKPKFVNDEPRLGGFA